MDIAIISFVAFAAALLTFFSGFGLGTLLTPVFMLFFPAELSIALTGVVHFFNNVFKLLLVGKKADKQVLLKFGIPAVLAALAGSWLLSQISDLEPLYSYAWRQHTYVVYPIKFMVACLLFIFAWMELIPFFSKLEFNRDKLFIGGALSGFFGGLSGNQGALRSAFLIRAGLSKEAFIGTTVVVSTCVDVTRLSVYASSFSGNTSLFSGNWGIITVATFSAITGAYLGNLWLKKITLQTVQYVVATLLLVMSIALALGWL